jgi:molybdopterin molybdotransferase
MLTWQAGLAAVLALVPIGPKRRVRLEQAAGRTLALPLMARNDSPPFDSSAVDGFGVYPADVATAAADAAVRLQLVATIRAGDSTHLRLRRGAAVKLLTGACVPPSVGGVVMKEYCREEGRAVIVSRAVEPGENIRRRGGEFRKGQAVLPAGVRITPPVVGLLATFGYANVSVHAKPVVTIAVTGDELLSARESLRSGKIRDANSHALHAAVRALGVDGCRTMRLKDRPALLRRRLADALRRSDVLLTVGGMSVGDYDYVRPVLGALGVREVFWRMAIKPGKPTYFGVCDRPRRVRGGRGGPCLVFGLPGNPVAALVCFHQLVKPALLKMTGLASGMRPTLRATLVGARRKEAGRLEWVRGVMSSRNDEVIVQATAGQDSHMLGGLARANCLIQFLPGASYLADGEVVTVEPLLWRE